MSEARSRRQDHFNSSIFPSSPDLRDTNLSRDFNQKPRNTPTLQSSVFSSYDLPAPRPNPHRPADTQALLGNDQPDYYNKRHSAHIKLSETQFVPSFKEVSAFDRRQQEFYKGYSPDKYTKSKLEDV